ncbi:hypothetical protein ACHAWF_012237 [Thalassiosira exigua]
MEFERAEKRSDAEYVSVERGRDDGLPAHAAPADENDADASVRQATGPSTFFQFCRALSLGLLSALPTLVLVGVGAQASLASICIYVGQLVIMAVYARFTLSTSSEFDGVLRWFTALSFLSLTSAFKSGHLLASCDSALVKGVLYAVTALWECSNAALIVGGPDLLRRYNIDPDGPREIILYALAPCQVKFVQVESSVPHFDFSPGGRLCGRSVSIASCCLGCTGLYLMLVKVQPFQSVVTSFVLLELEYLALMASMAVVALDIPSFSWQLIHDLLSASSLFAPPPTHSSATRPAVILPYGCVYFSNSTRQFWSRWSRPATQFIRHMLYYPLGGKSRWYISIPVMFLLNATTHFDLSYALVGDKSELYWISLFGTLAGAAMLEVAGDTFIAGGDNDGTTPRWYEILRLVSAHASLRVALYIMIHKCLNSSLGQLLGSDFDSNN